MVHIDEIIEPSLLADMISEGYITARPHHDKPWTILNYTPKAQYDWKWNAATVAARGLVFNHETNEVIARPFEKFFNWDQGVGNEVWQNPMPPTGPVVRMEKMDGSLGILCAEYDADNDHGYPAPVYEWVATRGSFHSEQAEWASLEYLNVVKEQTHTRPQSQVFEPKFGKTYLFEIIFPENRIVVDYGDYKGLVLIDVIDNETGHSDLQEFDDCKWPDKVTRIVLNHGFDSGQAAEIPDGDEGFVYLWPNINYRTKMKSAQYVELHRLVSNLSEKSVWDAMMAGKSASDIKDGLPDEFHGFVDEVHDKISSGAVHLMTEAYREYERLYNSQMSRKDFAIAAKDSPFKKFLFMILDDKSIYPVALSAMKPNGGKPLISED